MEPEKWALVPDQYSDAITFREAARVIRRRRKRKTFMPDVLIHALQSRARRIESGDG